MENNVSDDIDGIDSMPPKTYEDGIIDAVTVISIFGILAFCGYVFYIVPKFKDIFYSLRVDIPVPTQFVLKLSKYPALLCVLLGGVLIAIELVRRRRSMKLAFLMMAMMVTAEPAAEQAIKLPIYAIQDALRKK